MDYKTGEIEVEVKTSHPGEVKVEILEDGGQTTVAFAKTPVDEKDLKAKIRIRIPNARLWSTETSNLYICRATFGGDVLEETFGIRTLKWDLAVTVDMGVTEVECYEID